MYQVCTRLSWQISGYVTRTARERTFFGLRAPANPNVNFYVFSIVHVTYHIRRNRMEARLDSNIESASHTSHAVVQRRLHLRDVGENSTSAIAKSVVQTHSPPPPHNQRGVLPKGEEHVTLTKTQGQWNSEFGGPDKLGNELGISLKSCIITPLGLDKLVFDVALTCYVIVCERIPDTDREKMPFEGDSSKKILRSQLILETSTYLPCSNNNNNRSHINSNW